MKILLTLFIFTAFNLFAEKNITFKFQNDSIVTESGQIFNCFLVNDSEIPHENEQLIFPKFDDHRCHDGFLHAIAIDTGKEFLFRYENFRPEILYFLRENAWEINWEKIEQLREMTIFEFLSSENATIAKNNYAQFVIPKNFYVGKEGRFLTSAYLTIFGDNGSSLFPKYVLQKLPEEMIEYLDTVVNDLEIELGTKVHIYVN